MEGAKATMTYRGPSQKTKVNDGMNCMLVESVFRTICGANVPLDMQYKAGKTKDSICGQSMDWDCESECFEDKPTTTSTTTTTTTGTTS